MYNRLKIMDFNHNDDTLRWAQLQGYKLNIWIKFDNFLLFLDISIFNDNSGFSIGTVNCFNEKMRGKFSSFGTLFISAMPQNSNLLY